MRLRFWLLATDVMHAINLATYKAWLWCVCRASDADDWGKS